MEEVGPVSSSSGGRVRGDIDITPYYIDGVPAEVELVDVAA